MGIHRGPNTVKDGLVFGYDTGYGIADNETLTRFYPGEPTDNKLSLFTSGNQSLSYGSNIYIVTAQETNVSDVTAPNGQYSRFTGNSDSDNNQVFWSYAGNSNNYTGSTVTFSTYLKGSGTCHLTTYDDQSGYGVSSTITLTNEWVRYSYTRAINASATSHWSGVRGILTSTNVYIAASQTEIKGHATPFTETTRSSTASLIDLKKTANIDVSNVSFDSTGQPTFDATNDYVNVPNASNLNLTSQGTISVWINPSTLTQGSYAGLVSKALGGSTNQQSYGLSWRQVSNAFWGEICNGSGTYNQVTAPFPTVANVWYNIVFTWNGSQLVIYNNGVSVGTLTQTINCQALATDLTIGGYTYKGAGGSNEYFNGKISNVKLYNIGLTATEVQQNYNAYKNRFDI